MWNPKPRRVTLYRIVHRILKEECFVAHTSADEACKSLGWLIGDVFIQEIRHWNDGPPH